MGFSRARIATRSTLLFALVAVLILFMFAATALAADTQSQAGQGAGVKNVIVMIADGTGYNMFLAGDYYQNGKAKSQIYERFPVSYAVSTFPAGGAYDPLRYWTEFNYPMGWNAYNVTESNMAASAMATGVKCQAGVGVDVNLKKVANIMEIAETAGKATGVVSTQSFSEATPAGFSAHANDRKALKAITEQQLKESKLDVVMGAYHPLYNLNGEKLETGTFDAKNKLLWNEATWTDLVAGKIGNDADGDGTVEYWDLVESRADFQALATGEAPERVAGVVQVGGDATLGSGYTQFYRTGAADDAPFAVPLLETSPTLTEMSLAAINVLDADPDGFVLMIEGANVDYGNHFGWLGRALEELVDFNDAVDAVYAWVEANSSWNDTLLIVTADHETGGMWGPDSTAGMAGYPSAPRFIVRGDTEVFVPIVNNGAGNLPTVTYYNHRAAYDNPDTGVKFYWHTNALVPLWAKGANAQYFKTQVRGVDPVRGAYIDNTDIFDVMYHSVMK